VKIEAYELTDTRYLQPIAADALSQAWFDDDTPRWIRVHDFSEDEVLAMIEPLDLHPLAVDGCVHAADMPKVVVLDEVIFINYPILRIGAEEGLGYLRIVCLPTKLITISSIADEVVGRVVDKFAGNAMMVAPTIGALLYHLLDEILRANGPPAMALSTRIKRAVKNLEGDHDAAESAGLMSLSRDTDELIAVVENQMYCSQLLQASKPQLLQASSAVEYFRDLEAETVTIDQFVNRLERRVRDLKQIRAMGVDERTSKRLRVLTILTAIYMPPTLIAAIYGMNFENIPIVQLPHGYAIVLLIMATVVIGQIIFFIKRGWFT